MRPATIFLGQRRRGDGLARAEEGSGEESARASAFFFEKIGGYKIKKIHIEKIVDFCYACFVSKESNGSYFYTIKSSILWQLYPKT